jgi:hypothetical protein
MHRRKIPATSDKVGDRIVFLLSERHGLRKNPTAGCAAAAAYSNCRSRNAFYCIDSAELCWEERASFDDPMTSLPRVRVIAIAIAATVVLSSVNAPGVGDRVAVADDRSMP